jgi:DNA-binding NarL/FixJ family response regulator
MSTLDVRKGTAPGSKATGGPISVLVVDDHTIVRQGLCKLLARERGIEVVGEAKDGRQAVALASALDPDVILMDIGMPNLNGIEATRQIRAAAPRSKVLILSAHSDRRYVDGMNALGVVGYLFKQSSLTDLARAIRRVARVAVPVVLLEDERLVSLLPVPAAVHAPAPKPAIALSVREAEVLQLLAEGAANSQAAETLGIRVKTVEKHRQSIMKKLDLHDVAGLTRYAIACGVIECRTPESMP